MTAISSTTAIPNIPSNRKMLRVTPGVRLGICNIAGTADMTSSPSDIKRGPA
jgi:hypothetical protein